LAEAEQVEAALVDHEPGAPSVRAVDHLVDRVLEVVAE
jgi:hypothetical protein